MYLLLENNFVFCASEEIVFARPNMEKGYLEACTKEEAEYIWDKTNNSAYPVKDSNFTFVEYTGEVPTDIAYGKYIYSDGTIVANPDYTEPVSIEDQVKTHDTDIETLKASNLVLENELLGAQIALTEQYEVNITLEEQLAATQQELLGAQIALTDVYEQLIALQEAVNN